MSVARRFIVLPVHAPRVRMSSHWIGRHDHTPGLDQLVGCCCPMRLRFDACALNPLRSAEHLLDDPYNGHVTSCGVSGKPSC